MWHASGGTDRARSRFSHVEDGACIIGIEQRALVIPVAFDVFVGVSVDRTGSVDDGETR